MTLASVQYLRTKDGTERVVMDLAEFQALLDAAATAEHGLPDVKELIRELKAALQSSEGYVGVDDFLAEYDAAHRTS